MSIEENKAIARKANEIFWNEKKVELLDELFHKDYSIHGGTGVPWTAIGDRESFKENIQKADPSRYQVEVHDIFGEGDKVAVRMTAYRGGKPYANHITIYRFQDGKIIDDWFCFTSIKE
jgi:ketosteroid isomerase-like protein